jgi:hypothetical protein
MKAAADKPRQDGEVSKGGRGNVDAVKAKALATAKDHGIGKRTVERAIAKAEGREPKSERADKITKLDGARANYVEECKKREADLKSEREVIDYAFRQIEADRAKRASN